MKQFTNGTPKRTSLEGYIGSEVSLFDIGDFSLLTNLYVYPGVNSDHVDPSFWDVDPPCLRAIRVRA